MILLLDIGNSRLKWALLQDRYGRGAAFSDAGVLELSALSGPGAPFRRLLYSRGPLAGIEVCNVAGAAIEHRVRAIARSAGLAAPHFVRTQARAGGVRNAYAEPWRLGVDRWAALIGARAAHPRRAICLVAVGTAMTIDLLDAVGRHRGGSIMPGPKLMIDALLDRTAGIQRRAGGRDVSRALPSRRLSAFARNTRDAVTVGAFGAAAGLVQESVRAARTLLGTTPMLILSGGAADALARQLRLRHRRADDLVLRGLAALRASRALE
jgi:type III pantothenate kinase